MAELRVAGRDGEPVTDHPWQHPLELGWGRSEDRPRRLRVGGTPISDEALLSSPLRIPWLPTPIEWEDASGRRSFSVRLADGARPDSARVEILRGFARTLAARKEMTLEHVEGLSLFSVTTLWKWLEPTPLDQMIDESLGSIAEACARPRSWLREERIVQPVARVRRPARDAVRHLSRHPEHAGNDGLRTYPERILASIQEEELDIYENRVLIGIVRRLDERALRIRERVSVALTEIEGLRVERDRAHRFAQFRRYGRLRKLLTNKGEDVEQVIERAQRFLQRLQAQLRSLEACLTTPLGLALRFSPLPTSPLRETNILTWDTNYRMLPVLWQALEEEARERQPLDLTLDDDDAVWLDFCHLALLRALVELGFSGKGPVTTHLLGGAGAAEGLRRSTPGGDWCASVQTKGGVLVLDLHREAPTRALAAPVHRAPGQRVADTRPAAPVMVSSVRFAPTFCGQAARPGAVGPRDVWLHPHPLAELPGGGWTAGQAVASVHGERGRAVAVAPWSFGSIDRLGRLVQLNTLGAELKAGEVRESCPAGCSEPSRAGKQGTDRTCGNLDCEISWGFRMCNCGARVPKVIPKAPSSDVLEELIFDHDEPVQRLLLAEQLGGRDLLANWCMADDGIGTAWMVCPSCGKCGRPGCEGCGR